MNELPVIQHWVLCRKARVIPPVGPHNLYGLSGTGYRFVVPASVGMSLNDPWPIKALKMFARFFGGSGSVDFEVQQWWIDRPNADEPQVLVEVFGPFTVFFRAGETVRDYVFPLRRVPLAGVGRYQFRLVPLPSEPGDDSLAVEYLEVVQP